MPANPAGFLLLRQHTFLEQCIRDNRMNANRGFAVGGLACPGTRGARSPLSWVLGPDDDDDEVPDDSLVDHSADRFDD